MENSRAWYRSKGVIGSVLAFVIFGLRLLGKEPEAEVIEADAPVIAEWIVNAAGMVVSAIALWGRIKAKGPIAPVL